MAYNGDSIQVLEGLEPVRKKPGMYIGAVGSKGLHHILWEIVDNSIDEVANGYGTEVNIEIYPDNSISVQDDGRGIPFGINTKHNKPAVQLIFGTLHAGGKFEDSNYNFSGGLHGVGASVTNALSRWLKVETFINGEHFEQNFHSIEVNGEIKSGAVDGDIKKELCNKKLKGSKVTFLADDRVFPKEKYNLDLIVKRAKELAFLNPGLKISIKDNRVINEETQQPVQYNFQFDAGLSDFVQYINRTRKSVYPSPVYLEATEKNPPFKISVAFQHTDDYVDNILSYVNNIPTTEGGTHDIGFKIALTKVLNDFARQKGILKDKQENFQGEDFRQGLTAVISIKMKNPLFEGQTKSKLGNLEIKSLVEQLVSEQLLNYLIKAKKDVIDGIYRKATDAAKERESIRKAKNLARQKNKLSENTLVGKLASCTGRKSEINEIFIVEGDSAGGSAKQGRDRSFQAILPLRGKPLNVEKQKVEKILENEEIISIINALGAGFGEDFDLSNLKYNKVIILADADQDGAHIRSILLTFFYRYMQPLIKEGHVYVGMPPLYKIDSKDGIQYAYDDDELEEILKDVPRGYKLQRYKGLGEMNPEQLWETTLNPNKRALMQVNIDDMADADVMVSILMGSNAEERKVYISEHANFNKKDTFEDIGK